MTDHRWPGRVLRGDYIRAVLGLTVTAGPLVLVDEALWATVVFGVLALLFAWFLARTIYRHRVTVTVDDESIRVGSRIIRWTELRTVKARHFGSQRRDRGYVEAALKGNGTRITVDSQLTDSLALFRRLRRAVETNKLALDDRTRAALAALGV